MQTKESLSQHHVHPNFPFTDGNAWPCGTSFLFPGGGAMLLLYCADAGLQPAAAGLRNACDPYSSWAGSMVPLLHINANATTWKELFAIPLPPNHRNKTCHSVFSSLLVLYQFIICLRIYTDANMFIRWAKDGRAQTELCMTWAGHHLTRQENDGDRTRWTLNTQTDAGAPLRVCTVSHHLFLQQF